VKIAIAQPTYLPWLGYFDLLDQVDQFVLLDSVQFEKQSWQQRNRIKTPTGLQWLTVPVVFRGKLGQRIADVEIREREFWRDHIRAIELNYRRAPYFDEYFEALSKVLASETAHGSLSRLTTEMLGWFAQTIGLKTPTIRSSELPVQGKRTDLLAAICVSLGADAYLSPLGSAEYLLGEMTILTGRGIEVTFHHYDHPIYKQMFPPFVPFASVLDLMFNEGERALEIIRSGRRQALPPEGAAAHIAAHVNERVNS
jgi:hypothetical protein